MSARDTRVGETVLLVIFAALAAACSGGSTEIPKPAAKTTADDRGALLVAEYVKRDASPYRHDHVRFVVTEKDGKAEVTEIEVWRKQVDGTTTTLSLVTKPAEDAGTGSLTIEEKDKPSVNVTYSKSRDEFRETDTGKMFFGGLTIQELLGEWSKYDYKVIKELDMGGHKDFEVEGKLKSGQKSVIDSMKVEFDGENYLPINIGFFDSTGKELRTYSRSDVRTSGGHQYIGRVEVDNYVYNSHTTIEILNREYPDKLDDAIFTRDKLKASAKN